MKKEYQLHCIHYPIDGLGVSTVSVREGYQAPIQYQGLSEACLIITFAPAELPHYLWNK